MSAALCFITWKVAIGRSNWTRAFAYSTARPRALSQVPTSSAQTATARSSRTRRQIARLVAFGPDTSGGASVQVDSSDLARHVESRDRIPTGFLQQEGTETFTVACDDQGPVGAGAVEHDRLVTGEGPRPVGAFRRGVDGAERVAVPRLFDRDGAPLSSGCEACKQLVGTETHRCEGRRDRRRQEGAGEREPAELFLEDHQVDEAQAEATCAFGQKDTEPAEIGHGGPELGRHPDRVFDHLPHIAGRRLGCEGRGDRPPEVLLFLGEGEVHCRVPSDLSRRQLTRSMTVAFAWPPPSHMVWNP